MTLTVKQAVDIGTKTLETGGCATPHLDARVLMLHLLNEEDNYFIIHSGEMIGEKTLDEYFELVDVRALGKPVQYITGKQAFWKLKFIVDENVLIPRPDTEILVEKAIKIAKEISKHENIKILDIGCGSGAIGVSMAHEFPKASVTAVDISKKALEITQKNAQANHVYKQMKFVHGNMMEPFAATGFSKVAGVGVQKFDLILSNPPYIKSDVLPTLQREIVEFEPMLALDGGEDGLKYYRLIADRAHLHMRKNGALILEIGHDQGQDVCEILIKTWKYRDVQITKDLAGNDRVISARLVNTK